VNVTALNYAVVQAPPSALPTAFVPNPNAEACRKCQGNEEEFHVITHECLQGDALRCVIKSVPVDTPLELDDYVRSGDVLKLFDAKGHDQISEIFSSSTTSESLVSSPTSDGTVVITVTVTPTEPAHKAAMKKLATEPHPRYVLNDHYKPSIPPKPCSLLKN